jgi:23S rRNA (adenine2503-C2)-methyltransferase
MLPEDLVTHMGAHQIALDAGHARRLLAHLIARGRDDLAPRTRLPQAALRVIAATTTRRPLEIVERACSAQDGFVKYLLQAPDGARFEAVRIPLRAPGRFSVCLSTQVGCDMGCVFCATGRQGLTRNLQAWEIVASFLAVRADTEGVLSGAVLMGQGEPFQNYDEVIQACRVLSHPCGARVSQEAISISTVGLPAAIRRYTREGHRHRLIVSLTSAVQARRRALLPVAGRVPLTELAAALRAHARATRTPVTVAWVLLGGVNTGPDEIEALTTLFGDVPIRLNLIDVNETRGRGQAFAPASDQERGAFHDALRRIGVPVVRRYSGGAHCHAACGMLTGARTTL